jgi:hypothetical protein
MSTPRYNTANIRNFLTRAFSADELRNLCYDDPELRPIIDRLSMAMGPAQIAAQIIEFCDRKMLFDRLLDLAQEGNPRQYYAYRPYRESEQPDQDPVGRPVQSQPSPASSPWPTLRPPALMVEPDGDPGGARRLRVFLSYAAEDEGPVRDLYARLRSSGIDPWFDKENLLGGSNRKLEIEKAVRQADVVLVFLSSRSVNKVGSLQKEISIAVDAAEYRPEGTIYCVPVRLQECEVPARLSQWQPLDLYASRGYEQLMRTLRARASELEGVAPPTGVE